VYAVQVEVIKRDLGWGCCKRAANSLKLPSTIHKLRKPFLIFLNHALHRDHKFWQLHFSLHTDLGLSARLWEHTNWCIRATISNATA
jgi:hypothetical protein